MGWAKFCETFDGHPKVLRAGFMAKHLLAAAIRHCARFHTDGMISLREIYEIARWDGMAVDNDELIGRLCENGLMRRVSADMYEIHDFLDYHFTKQENTERRTELSEKRAAAGKKSGEARRAKSEQATNKPGTKREQNGNKNEPDPDPDPDPYLKPKTTVGLKSDHVVEVFDHYRTHHPRAHRKPSPKSKEWRAIKARFAEGYTVQDLCSAIDGCHKSPWHMGANERGRKYDSLELITRDGSKVQQFMEFARNGAPRERSKSGAVNMMMDILEDGNGQTGNIFGGIQEGVRRPALDVPKPKVG